MLCLNVSLLFFVCGYGYGCAVDVDLQLTTAGRSGNVVFSLSALTPRGAPLAAPPGSSGKVSPSVRQSVVRVCESVSGCESVSE